MPRPILPPVALPAPPDAPPASLPAPNGHEMYMTASKTALVQSTFVEKKRREKKINKKKIKKKISPFNLFFLFNFQFAFQTDLAGAGLARDDDGLVLV